jgi:hypothetical protein
MATYYAPEYYVEPVGASNFPGLIVRSSTQKDYDLSTATYSDADKLRFFKLPANAKLIDCAIFAGDAADAGADLEIAVYVTDGTTTKYFFNTETALIQAGADIIKWSSSVASADAATATSAYGYVTTDDDFWVEVLLTDLGTNAATDFRIEISYTMVLEPGEVNV